MAIKNVAASLVLGLLFVSLVAIYLVIPRNNLVTFLSVLIMLISLIVALTGREREIAVMGAFAGLVTVVAASFVGRALFGGLGAVLLPVLLAIVVLMIFNWFTSSVLRVQKDRAILIARPYTGTLYQAPSPIGPPIMPYFERKIAEIPLYDLSEDVHVEKVNTKRFNVDLIDVHIHYRVVDPKRALGGLRNRGQVQSTIAKEIGFDINKARLDVTFWEKLLGYQMKLEVEDIVRDVVYNNPFAQNPLEVYANREDLAGEVQDRLSKLASQWGVEIKELGFDRVDVDFAVIQRINKAGARMDETELKEIEAKREATRIKLTGEAQAQAEAQRVTEMVRALKESGIELSAEDLREIVMDAVRASTEWGMESELMRYAPVPPAPGSDKKSNGSKK
jgi:hypothetical protein